MDKIDKLLDCGPDKGRICVPSRPKKVKSVTPALPAQPSKKQRLDASSSSDTPRVKEEPVDIETAHVTPQPPKRQRLNEAPPSSSSASSSYAERDPMEKYRASVLSRDEGIRHFHDQMVPDHMDADAFWLDDSNAVALHDERTRQNALILGVKPEPVDDAKSASSTTRPKITMTGHTNHVIIGFDAFATKLRDSEMLTFDKSILSTMKTAYNGMIESTIERQQFLLQLASPNSAKSAETLCMHVQYAIDDIATCVKHVSRLYIRVDKKLHDPYSTGAYNALNANNIEHIGNLVEYNFTSLDYRESIAKYDNMFKQNIKAAVVKNQASYKCFAIYCNLRRTIHENVQFLNECMDIYDTKTKPLSFELFDQLNNTFMSLAYENYKVLFNSSVKLGINPNEVAVGTNEKLDEAIDIGSWYSNIKESYTMSDLILLCIQVNGYRHLPSIISQYTELCVPLAQVFTIYHGDITNRYIIKWIESYNLRFEQRIKSQEAIPQNIAITPHAKTARPAARRSVRIPRPDNEQIDLVFMMLTFALDCTSLL